MENRFIKKLAHFAPLTEADRAALSEVCATSRKVRAHYDLIREGERPGPFIVFLAGWGARSKLVPDGQRQIVALMMPGDCCDLHANALVEMDHTISALTPATIATISRHDMDRLIDIHPNVLRALYVSQLIDEGTSRAWIVGIGRRSSRERVAHLICELYLRARSVGLAQDNRMELPLTQTLLADALGMTPVHINRVLRALRLDGAMAVRGGGLAITDPAELNAIAGFDENYLHRRLNTTGVMAGNLR